MNMQTEVRVRVNPDRAQIALLHSRIEALEAELARCKSLQAVRCRKTEREIAEEQLMEYPAIITHGVGTGIGIGGFVSDILFGEINTCGSRAYLKKSGEGGYYKRRLTPREMSDEQYAAYTEAVSRVYKAIAEVIMEFRGEELRRLRK